MPTNNVYLTFCRASGPFLVVPRGNFLALVVIILMTTDTTPLHDYFILSLGIRSETARPLLIQDGNVMLLFEAFRIAFVNSSPRIGIVFHRQCHALAAHDRSVRLNVRTSKI